MNPRFYISGQSVKQPVNIHLTVDGEGDIVLMAGEVKLVYLDQTTGRMARYRQPSGVLKAVGVDVEAVSLERGVIKVE